MKKILVTGGTGLIGSHLLLFLAKANHPLVALYRTEKSLDKVKAIFKADGETERFQQVEWKKGDINDYFALESAFEGVELVYHAAAKVSFHQYDAEEMMNTNIQGTANVVNLCLEHQIKKLCYVSSVAALGESKNGHCISESNDWINSSNTSNYSISKYYAENEVWRGSEEGLDVVIVNPSYILGFGDWNESSLQIFKRVFQGLSYYSTGSNGFVDVEDVVAVMVKLMHSNVKNERYVLCSENLSFIDLFKLMSKGFNRKAPQLKVPKRLAILAYWMDQMKSKLMNRKAILTQESVNSAYSNKCFDSSKIKNELNYDFKPISQSIAEATEKFLQHPTPQF